MHILMWALINTDWRGHAISRSFKGLSVSLSLKWATVPSSDFDMQVCSSAASPSLMYWPNGVTVTGSAKFCRQWTDHLEQSVPALRAPELSLMNAFTRALKTHLFSTARRRWDHRRPQARAPPGFWLKIFLQRSAIAVIKINAGNAGIKLRNTEV